MGNISFSLGVITAHKISLCKTCFGTSKLEYASPPSKLKGPFEPDVKHLEALVTRAGVEVFSSICITRHQLCVCLLLFQENLLSYHSSSNLHYVFNVAVAKILDIAMFTAIFVSCETCGLVIAPELQSQNTKYRD